MSRDPNLISKHAKQNDANRTGLIVLTGIVMVVLLAAIAAETMDQRPEPLTKMLVIATLFLAWLFSNLVYAFHYTHLAYRAGKAGSCTGLDFPGTPEPVYWDFVYFAFTLGMTFQTSDVTVSDSGIRKFVRPALVRRVRVQHRRARLHDQRIGLGLGHNLDFAGLWHPASSRDDAAADDQRRAGESVQRDRLPKHDPATGRCPEEAAIFGRGEVARLPSCVGPGEDQSAAVDNKDATITHAHCPSGSAGRPTNGTSATHKTITVRDWKKLISNGSAASD